MCNSINSMDLPMAFDMPVNGNNAGLGGYQNFNTFGNSSVFNGGYGMNSFGCSPYGGYGYNQKTMEQLNNMTPEQYLQFQSNMQKQQMQSDIDMQKYQMQSNLDMQKANTSLQIQSQGNQMRIQRAATILHQLIKENRQDEVMGAYENLASAVKAQLNESSTSNFGVQKGKNNNTTDAMQADQLKAYVEQAYAQVTGAPLTEDIEGNSDSDFVHGLKQGLFGGLGLTNSRSAQENIAEISGVKEDKSEKALGYVGTAVGVAATAALGLGVVTKGVGLVGSLIAGGLKFLKK